MPSHSFSMFRKLAPGLALVIVVACADSTGPPEADFGAANVPPRAGQTLASIEYLPAGDSMLGALLVDEAALASDDPEALKPGLETAARVPFAVARTSLAAGDSAAAREAAVEGRAAVGSALFASEGRKAVRRLEVRTGLLIERLSRASDESGGASALLALLGFTRDGASILVASGRLPAATSRYLLTLTAASRARLDHAVTSTDADAVTALALVRGTISIELAEGLLRVWSSAEGRRALDYARSQILDARRSQAAGRPGKAAIEAARAESFGLVAVLGWDRPSRLDTRRLRSWATTLISERRAAAGPAPSEALLWALARAESLVVTAESLVEISEWRGTSLFWEAAVTARLGAATG